MYQFRCSRKSAGSLVWALLMAAGPAGYAEAPTPIPPPKVVQEPIAPEWFNIHFQATVLTQVHPSFSARYSGRNSMQTDAESATSIVTELFAGLRLWKGGLGVPDAPKTAAHGQQSACAGSRP